MGNFPHVLNEMVFSAISFLLTVVYVRVESCSLFYLMFYVDKLISLLKNKKLGCRVGMYYVGYLPNADDLILVSASLRELQDMLDLCSEFGDKVDIVFNAKKSVCMVVGKQRKIVSASLSLNNSAHVHEEKLKYLGVLFSAFFFL